MSLLSIVPPRSFGVIFYYPPTSSMVNSLIPLLNQLEWLFPWPEEAEIHDDLQLLSLTKPQSLSYDFSILFEGQGMMPAPPWGSVYLEKDNLVMGESMLKYRSFIAESGINRHTDKEEPDDQFGLMLMAFSLLLENDAIEEAKMLLKEHLLPWAPRYLELVQQTKTEQNFYPRLAKVISIYLQTLMHQLKLSIGSRQLYF